MKILIRSLSPFGDEVLNNLLQLKEKAKNERMSDQQRLALTAIRIEKMKDKPLEVCYIIRFFEEIPINAKSRRQIPPLFSRVHDMMHSVGAKENRDYEVEII